MQQSSATPKNQRCREGVAEDCCMLSLLLTVPSCIYSFWHGGCNVTEEEKEKDIKDAPPQKSTFTIQILNVYIFSLALWTSPSGLCRFCERSNLPARVRVRVCVCAQENLMRMR